MEVENFQKVKLVKRMSSTYL